MKHKTARIISGIASLFLLFLLILVAFNFSSINEDACQNTLASVVVVNCMEDYATLFALFAIMIISSTYLIIDHRRQRK